MAAEAAQNGPSLEALLDGGLDTPALLALADRIAAVHAGAARANAATAAAFRRSLATGGSAEQARELQLHSGKLDARAAMGRFRLIGGEPTDILYDLSLPLMELWRNGLTTEASLLANRYIDVAPQGATGWALLPLYISLLASRADAMGFAAEILRPSPPRLVAIGGLSGTGKSTLARLIGGRLGRAPGARTLRSDIFRKRLAGVPPETRLPSDHYTPKSYAETYEALFESADDHLACGSCVILDAVFMSRSERDVAEMIALRRGVPFTGIWLEAPERDRVMRVSSRDYDASDAGPEVVREQSRRPVGDVGYWNRMRVNRPIELIVAAARGILERRPRR